MISTAILGLFFTSCGLTVPQPSIDEQRISMRPYDHVRVQGMPIQQYGDDRVVQIFNDQGAGLATRITEDGYYLTATHVIEGGTSFVYASRPDRKPMTFRNLKRGKTIILDPNQVAAYEARVVAVFKNKDIALLKASVKSPRYFRIAEKPPTSSTLIFSAGNPVENQPAGGVVYSAKRYKESWEIYSSAPLRQGDSGGPLFDSKGQLIGINVSVFMQTGFHSGFHHSISRMIAPQTLQSLIAEDRKKR